MLDLIRDVSRRVRLLVTKALINSVIDSGDLQIVKIKSLGDDVLTDIERVQNYGLSGNPPKNSQVIVIQVCGSRDNLVAVAVDNSASRPKDLESGEVCVYSEHGQTVLMDENGDINSDAGTHVFNGGSRSTARKDDSVMSTALEDEVFWAWVSAAGGVLANLGVAAPIPTTLTGKITDGTDEVKVP